MSKRHTLVTLVLLSSSTAFAGPPKHRPTPLMAKIAKIEQRITKSFHVEADQDGYPMVGNIKGKVGGGTDDDGASAEMEQSRELDRELAKLDARYISRIFSR